MASKPDIVSLLWVAGLMNRQAEEAEKALVEYSADESRQHALLQCTWSVYQITSTLRALDMPRGELLTQEMERCLNYLYNNKLQGERRKLAMGGLMQALKLLPAYLAYVQDSRIDSGQGLEPHINDLRRWMGERPKAKALFFYMEVDSQTGITPDAPSPNHDEIRREAGALLAPYLDRAKKGLRREDTRESMKAVARISRKMQLLFAGTPAERFWLTMIGLCEGIAGNLIVPDDCIAQVFKAGAFMIKYAREHGGELDPAVDLDDYLQQMLYYMAACQASPRHISHVREVFGIDDDTLANASRGLVHMDAILAALGSAQQRLEGLVGFLNSNDLFAAAKANQDDYDTFALETIEAARYRLEAAGQMHHADALLETQNQLKSLYSGQYREGGDRLDRVVAEISRAIMDVKLDVEHKLEYGMNSAYSSREFEIRESVVKATFRHMARVEEQLHHILRRKALAAALARKPNDAPTTARLIEALNRYLNKSEEGYDELRRSVADANRGDPDLDLLYSLSRTFLDEVQDTPDREAIALSLELLDEMAGALSFAGLEQEGDILGQCRQWLEAASKAGEVREDKAFRRFAGSFADIQLHLERNLLDPLDDTSHLLARAEQTVQELMAGMTDLSHGADVALDMEGQAGNYVEDSNVPPEIRQVFIEETDEIVQELSGLAEQWLEEPAVDGNLRDMRRHFHTFKGNGRAVGANILGELGWAAQDLLDRVLDGDLVIDTGLVELMREIIGALPGLVYSYREESGLDVRHTRELTNRCFALANGNTEVMPADEIEVSGAVSLMNAIQPTEAVSH